MITWILIRRMLREIARKVDLLIAKGEAMSKQLDDLEAQVAASSTVVDGAITLLKGLHDQLVAAGTDPARLDAIKAGLKAKTDALAAAVAENTVAASEPPAPAPAPADSATPAPVDSAS